jgi:hypothetical protein
MTACINTHPLKSKPHIRALEDHVRHRLEELVGH